ncbi:ABC transporter ATP-binding protein [Streptomyces griseus]|uniref:ABC transporter ATP-binding protein n=1 Tax=Streptomyces griseus TaxID=1911 RepID=UPI000565E690|nr:ATP-binding cassette domain-containing protein [Streptomyces griseus]
MTDIVDITGLTKRYGELTAVEDVSFTVRSGRVVGLLGRNGAGKTTTLRMLLGLARPTSGRATIFGHPYAQLPRAAHRVGVSIDGIGPSGAASGRADLGIWAKTIGLPRTRVDDVLEQVGLAEDAHRRLRDYSQGMRQRHALATALLADPELLILDEPANGLDPDGIRWLRELLRSLADEGRTVLVSSHILAEVEQMADDIVILQKTLRYSGTAADLTQNGDVSLESRFFDLVGPAAKENAHA